MRCNKNHCQLGNLEYDQNYIENQTTGDNLELFSGELPNHLLSLPTTHFLWWPLLRGFVTIWDPKRLVASCVRGMAIGEVMIE